MTTPRRKGWDEERTFGVDQMKVTMIRGGVAQLLIAFSAFALAGCITIGEDESAGPPALGAASTPAQDNGDGAPAPAASGDGELNFTEAEYVLGTGDELRVIVFGETDLSGAFEIDGSGKISIPLLGEVEAAGLTTRALERSIESDLVRREYLKDPRVSAEVTNYRPYYILGEVSQPGEYPYADGLTVMNAVATAAGFTYRADTRRVLIRRVGDNEEREVRLSADTPVLPGDTIRVPERWF